VTLVQKLIVKSICLGEPLTPLDSYT